MDSYRMLTLRDLFQSALRPNTEFWILNMIIFVDIRVSEADYI